MRPPPAGRVGAVSQLSDDLGDDLLRHRGPLRFPYSVEEQARKMAGAEMVHAAIGSLRPDGIRVSVGIKGANVASRWPSAS